MNYPNMPEVSDTPETDAQARITRLDCDDSCLPIYVYVDGKEYEGHVVSYDFACRLERERDEARKERDELAKSLKALVSGKTKGTLIQ